MSKTDYRPGEAGVIEVTFSAPMRVGPVTREILVQTNDHPEQEHALFVSANVIEILNVTPRTVSLNTKDNANKALLVTIVSNDKTRFNVGVRRVTLNALKIGEEPAGVESDKHTLAIRINDDIVTRTGIAKGRIYLTTSHPQCENVIVPFTIDVPTHQ